MPPEENVGELRMLRKMAGSGEYSATEEAIFDGAANQIAALLSSHEALERDNQEWCRVAADWPTKRDEAIARAEAAEAKVEALVQENERLKGERDDALAYTETLDKSWFEIAEQRLNERTEAEAERDSSISALSRLRVEVVEVLEPFAAAASRLSDRTPSACGMYANAFAGDDKHGCVKAFATAGDFRRAASLLASIKGKET